MAAVTSTSMMRVGPRLGMRTSRPVMSRWARRMMGAG